MPVINWNAVLVALIYGALTGLFNLAFAHRSQVESWVNEHPRLGALLKFTRAVGLDPQNVYSAATLFIEKRLPLAQQNGAKAVAQFKANSIAPPPPPPPPPDSVPPFGMGVALLLFMTLAGAQACATTAPPCSPQNPIMMAKAAECRARVQTECKGIPDNECPAIAECDRWGEERCK